VAELPLVSQLEALLFVAAEPVPLAQLATATGHPAAEVKQALNTLNRQLAGGIRLSLLDDRYQLVTAPAAAAIIRRFLQDTTKTELSRPALETLAIIAYRGPITKTAIEQVRGVSSDTTLRNLLGRGLIAEAGKSPEPGRPLLYAISHSFMQHVGLTNLADLPPLEAAGDSEESEP